MPAGHGDRPARLHFNPRDIRFVAFALREPGVVATLVPFVYCETGMLLTAKWNLTCHLRRPLATALALGLLLPLAACDLPYALMGFTDPVVQVAGPGAPVELPFREGPGGLVLLPARVNGGGDYDFILDTGAPVSVLLDGPGTEALKLDTRGARKLGAEDNPAAPIGVITPGFSLEFGPVRFSNLTAVVIPRQSLPCPARFDAVRFHGVIGADLFKRFVVEIDHDQKRVRLHEPDRLPGSLTTQLLAGTATELPLTFRGGHVYTDLKVNLPDVQVPVHVHVDTGKSSALSLITASRPEIKAPPGGEIQESCFVNGTTKSIRGQPVSVQMAGTVAREVPVTYEASDPVRLGNRQGAIGITLLKRYVTWIDYPGKRLVLVERPRFEPAHLAGSPGRGEGLQATWERPQPPAPPRPPSPPGAWATDPASATPLPAFPPPPARPPVPPAPSVATLPPAPPRPPAAPTRGLPAAPPVEAPPPIPDPPQPPAPPPAPTFPPST